MPHHPRESTATEPSAGAAARKPCLAALLADMVPGARSIRVSQREPDRNGPSLYARVYDAQGRLLALNRAQRLIAARWVIRASPELDWDEPHDLYLTSGALQPTAEGYAANARRR